MENERKPRQLTALRARNFEHKENVPCITLSGRWLKEYGFEPGDKVQVVSEENGKLTITKIAPEQ
jgi:hypothetical protein